MAISVDPSTFVITVPRLDMTLIQSTPTEIRELNTNAFRLELKAWEAGGAVDKGITFLKTHLHNTEVTLSGINYARIIEIIDPYTITFEDGQYAVRLVGSNNNIVDKTNKNQVSVLSNNSAGLISSTDIEFAQYADGVYVDQANGTGGTLHPTGTLRQPSGNLTDAQIIGNFRGVNTYNFLGDGLLTTGDNFTDSVFTGENANLTTITVDAGANVFNSEFKNCVLTGTLDGGSIVRDTIIFNLSYVNGVIFNSMLNPGTIFLGGSATGHFLNCFSGVPGVSTPIIDMGGSGQSLAMRNYNGGIELRNKTGPENVSIDLNSGQVKLQAASVTAGTIVVRGVGKLIDSVTGEYIHTGTWNGGVTIVNELVNGPELAETIWNAPAVNHNLAGTMAKLLQELYKLQGLDITQPLTVTQTQRVVDDINLALGGDGTTLTTVTRQP